MKLFYGFALALLILFPVSEAFADTDASYKSGNPMPIYPSMSKRMGEQGTVKLFVLVQADGTVGDIKIIESSGHKRLDNAAVDTIKTWKFNPATENEIPVSRWYTLPHRFSLGKEDSVFRPIPYFSEANIILLQKKLEGKNIYLKLGSAAFSKEVSETQSCRLTHSLALAEDMNVAQFIKESFKQGIQLAGMLDENSSNILSFTVDAVNLNTIYPAEWKISLTVFSEKNKGYQVQQIYPIKIDDYLESRNTCSGAFKSFPLAIQDLISKIISNDRFISLFD
jgi:TonB family protein